MFYACRSTILKIFLEKFEKVLQNQNSCITFALGNNKQQHQKPTTMKTIKFVKFRPYDNAQRFIVCGKDHAKIYGEVKKNSKADWDIFDCDTMQVANFKGTEKELRDHFTQIANS